MKMAVLWLAGFLGLVLNSVAQKRVLDSSTVVRFSEWPTVFAPFISSDGKYVLYTLTNIPTGSNTLVIETTVGDWKREFVGVERGVLSGDSKRIIFKTQGDSLCIMTLGKEESTYLPHVQSFQVVGSGDEESLAYKMTAPADELVIRSLRTGKERSFNGVKDYVINSQTTALVWRGESGADSSRRSILQWEDLSSGKVWLVWFGERTNNYVLDAAGRQLAFMTEANGDGRGRPAIWYYKAGTDQARLLVEEGNPGMDSDLRIDETAPVFSQDGGRLFFQLIEKPFTQSGPGGVKVDVWNYKDLDLQSWQLLENQVPKVYSAVIGVHDGCRVIRLQRENESLVVDHSGRDDQAIAYGVKAEEGWWNKDWYSTVYWVNTVDGSRKVIKDRLSYVPNALEFSFSPGGRWLLYFDRSTVSWYSYDVAKDITRNVSKGIAYPTYSESGNTEPISYPHPMVGPVGLCCWLSEGRSALLYDNYDLWQVDPSGARSPVNITHGYGRQHHLKLRVAWPEDRQDRVLSSDDTLLLSAFDCRTKYNGFYRMVLSASGNPQPLYMGPYVLYADGSQLSNYSKTECKFLRKARDGKDWILTRQSATEAPNLYTTRDFKTYQALSDCEPQERYNWLTSELVHWNMLDGKKGSGILYKPQNFNPNKKYPVIFLYYEQRSDDLYAYPMPSLSYAEINIPYYVSQGYLVFEPDIYYKMGHTGESVVNSVVSAAHYLSTRSYVDSHHLGLQGHSFGGFETIYLVTHTHLFAAAVEAAGQSDYSSGYGSLTFGYDGDGASMQYYQEISQGRIGATLWERPGLYITNSPVFRADRVTTPLLMMHNKRDGSVPFSQAVELFTALRRLSKRVWLLQYDEGSHAVMGEKNQQDYTLRMLQFFDYYLKETPAPVWMTQGIPAKWKGIRTGYELDKSGRQP